MQGKRKKICIVATIANPLMVFMKPHILMLAKYYDVTLIANADKQEVQDLLGEHVCFVSINIARKVSLWQDVTGLFALYRVFRQERFDVVHTLMPKTALLGMVAAFFARVPVRIHSFTGQVWANKTGIARWGLKALDRLSAMCATALLTDSFSQRQFLIDERVVKENKITVLGNGSVCGVDIERFRPNLDVRQETRVRLGIPESAIIYLFLGRLNPDKGVQDLAQAFSELSNKMPEAHLLIVGPDEGGMDVKLDEILKKCTNQCHRVGFTNKPEEYMACADIFCLPSYREGFGSVVIEAAAIGLPSIASRIYGLIDAVEHEVTGILHPPKDINAIKLALLRLTQDKNLRERMSSRAIVRTKEQFSTNMVVSEMLKYYQTLLNN
jgi:glycosyltransferase involved in cell wall biosynthesis